MLKVFHTVVKYLINKYISRHKGNLLLHIYNKYQKCIKENEINKKKISQIFRMIKKAKWTMKKQLKFQLKNKFSFLMKTNIT